MNTMMTLPLHHSSRKTGDGAVYQDTADDDLVAHGGPEEEGVHCFHPVGDDSCFPGDLRTLMDHLYI